MTRSPLESINLAHFAADLPAAQRDELVDQNARAQGLWERLRCDDVPGVILGDEVGKGKTYVALALAFATLAAKRHARVLILTHSRSMAQTWAARWRQEVSEMVTHEWRDRFTGDWKPRTVNEYTAFVSTLEETKRSAAIMFASYDTLKLFNTHEDRRRQLLGTLQHMYRTHRIRLSGWERNRLVKEMVRSNNTMPRRPMSVSARAAVRVLNESFDPETRDWNRGAQEIIDEYLDGQASLNLIIRPTIDLLIVDEAHKLEGDRRGRVVTHLLSGKFRKGVWVTATPFALTVNELRRRLLQFEHASEAPGDYRPTIEALPLAPYQRAVSERTDFAPLLELQSALRRRMVRSTWGKHNERRVIDWTRAATGATLLPSMVLERVMTNLLSEGRRTHVASIRETLCSSWAATLESLRNGALRNAAKDPWVAQLRNVLEGMTPLDPKLCAAVEELATLAQRGEKTVVFANRIETSVTLVNAINANPGIRRLIANHQRANKRWYKRADVVQRALKLPTLGMARTLSKVIAFSPDAPPRADPVSVKDWWRRHRKSLEQQARSSRSKEIWDFLEEIAGRGRRLPIVARFDGEVSGGDESDPDTVGNDRKFNLPCAPLILVASRKAQEGIDLHHYCRRVVLYDLPWNPALIEQRIGRVHRLGGLRSRAKPVEVVYCYQKDSYEELIAERVKRRCEMMHTLLGAGTWLDQDREVDDLQRYCMTFPP
jgi:Type III restriction enzyme, res subunit/Helicase conserved C-terminal domain